MKIKIVMATVMIALLIVGAYAANLDVIVEPLKTVNKLFVEKTDAKQSKQPSQPLASSKLVQQTSNVSADATPTPSNEAEIPIQITYHFLFKRVAFLEEEARAADDKGEDGSKLRNVYRSVANLTAEQNDSLIRIATDCMAQVKITDDTALPIIDQVSAARQTEPYSPDAPPPPDPRLTALQRQRENTVLSYREMLRSSFGEEAFVRFEEVVKETISSNITTNIEVRNAVAPTSIRTSPFNKAEPSQKAVTPQENK